MEAGLNLLENPLVFVTCPRHVFDSCLDKTLLFLLVSSVGCMIIYLKKKMGEWCKGYATTSFSYLMYIYLC
jgi:hypothetical protein